MSDADPVRVERAPTQLSGRLAVVGAVLAAVAAASLTAAGGLLALAGTLLVVGGLGRCSRLLLMGGCAMLVGGAVLGGGSSGAALPALVGVGAGAYAWLVGEQAMNLGEQVGRRAPTRRVEAVHALSMGALVVVTGAVGYVAYLASAPTHPQFLVLLLLLSIVLMTYGSEAYAGDS